MKQSDWEACPFKPYCWVLKNIGNKALDHSRVGRRFFNGLSIDATMVNANVMPSDDCNKFMALSSTIVEQLKRIGATLPHSARGTVVEILILHVIWPDVAFMGSTERMRRYLTDQGVGGVATWSGDKLRDELPSTYEFRFLRSESRGKFWDGWEDQFPSVDSTKFVPFATDDYYFYFLTDNSDDASDPFAYSIDHEETAEEPYDGRGLTVSRLLSIRQSNETST